MSEPARALPLQRQRVLDHHPAVDPWSAALRSAFENAPLGMAIARPDGTVMAVNHAACRLLSADEENLLGRPLFGRVHPDDREGAIQACGTLRASASGTTEHECRFIVGADVLHVRVTSSRVDGARDVGGDVRSVPEHVVMHLEDITAARRREAELRLAALHDPLTRLPNRVLLEQHLQRALEARRPAGESVVVLFLDLDGFKAVNDRNGHAAGDAVLVAVAERIRSCLRPGDVAARVGGDEFVVLCAGLQASSAEPLAARIRTAVASPVLHAGTRLQVTASVGWASATQPVSAGQLLHDADTAMYGAKRRRP